MVSLLLLACVFCSCGVAAAGPALEDGWASKILEGVKLDTLKIGAPPASSALSNLAASISAPAAIPTFSSSDSASSSTSAFDTAMQKLKAISSGGVAASSFSAAASTPKFDFTASSAPKIDLSAFTTTSSSSSDSSFQKILDGLKLPKVDTASFSASASPPTIKLAAASSSTDVPSSGAASMPAETKPLGAGLGGNCDGCYELASLKVTSEWQLKQIAELKEENAALRSKLGDHNVNAAVTDVQMKYTKQDIEASLGKTSEQLKRMQEAMLTPRTEMADAAQATTAVAAEAAAAE